MLHRPATDGRLTGMRSEYFWRIRSASALRFSKGCSSLNLLRILALGGKGLDSGWSKDAGANVLGSRPVPADAVRWSSAVFVVETEDGPQVRRWRMRDAFKNRTLTGVRDDGCWRKEVDVGKRLRRLAP